MCYNDTIELSNVLTNMLLWLGSIESEQVPVCVVYVAHNIDMYVLVFVLMQTVLIFIGKSNKQINKKQITKCLICYVR